MQDRSRRTAISLYAQTQAGWRAPVSSAGKSARAPVRPPSAAIGRPFGSHPSPAAAGTRDQFGTPFVAGTVDWCPFEEGINRADSPTPICTRHAATNAPHRPRLRPPRARRRGAGRMRARCARAGVRGALLRAVRLLRAGAVRGDLCGVRRPLPAVAGEPGH